MAEKNIRSFSVKDQKFKIEILENQFTTSGDDISGRSKVERKFNIRIKQADICLLDAISNSRGVPRSKLINDIIHNILLDELMAMNDKDARVLLAEFADNMVTYDNLTQRWILSVLRKDIQKLIDDVVEITDDKIAVKKSAAFMGLYDRLKDI